jgi:hypothetical protein
MRVHVCGGITFNDRDWLWAGLDLLNSKRPITEIIEGGATGADVRAGEWARKHEGVKWTIELIEWEKHSAGLKKGEENPARAIRDRKIAEMRPDVVLACPGGKEVTSMVEAARAAGLTVIFLEKMPVLPSPTKNPLS